MQEMINKIKEYDTRQIKEIIIDLNEKYDEISSTIITAAMAALEKKIDEKEFIAFCESL